MSAHLDPILLEHPTLPREFSKNIALYTLTLALVFTIACLASFSLPIIFRCLDALSLLPATAGCKKLGIDRPHSNLLNDEYSERYAGGSAAGSGKSWRIKSLWIYPIKSCAGVELAASDVVKTGLDYDRHFMFAHLKKTPLMSAPDEKNAHRWEFATMREYPLLANVKVELWLPDSAAAGYSASLYGVQSRGVLRVVFPYKRAGLLRLVDIARAWFYGDAPGTTSFHVPYQPTPQALARRVHGVETVKIWKDFPAGLDMGSYVPRAALAAYLGARVPLTLFRSTGAPREVYRDAPRQAQLGWQPVALFNDAYPINMLGLASVHDVDRRQDRDGKLVPRVSARRFRANIILEGTPAYEEEKWRYVRMGGHEYYVVARCVRCKVPNVDPDTGERHAAEPDRTIRRFRAVDAGAPKGTGCMAVQLVPRDVRGKISVGDVIEVLEEGEHVYTPM